MLKNFRATIRSVESSSNFFYGDDILTDTDWSEHYIKRGDPTKPTYYIIRRRDPAVGLFSNFIVFAGHIRYALANGWLPVVDMQNYPNAYLPPEKFGKENSWEYYFEQPLHIGLKEAYSGENIILCGEKIFIPDGMNFLENRDNSLMEWRMLVKFGLLRVKAERVKEVLAVRQKLFAPSDRVLGVLLRGTDYIAMRPYQHPIPPPTEFAASVVVEKLKEWHCNKIFLATEDKNIMQIFKSVFGDLCVTFDREYVDYKAGQKISLVHIDRPNDHFQQGKDYLTQTVLLSMCNSFVAARCSGTTGVMMLAENFEHTYFFNLGRYGMISLG